MSFINKNKKWLAGTLLLASASFCLTGCQRQFWRQQADTDVQQIVQEKKCQFQNLPVMDYRFQAKSNSRFYLPYDRDNQPMPQDDATANVMMRCVYGKKGWKGWTKNGVIASVENPHWEQSLPRDHEGNVVLNRETAIQIALVNSPEYQTALENIYMSALRVSLRRYDFDIQYALSGGLHYDTAFHGYGHLELDSVNARASKYTALGGTFAAGIANSVVWTLGGDSDSSGISTTLLNMSFIQPLLRNYGRAYALESLTQTERAFICNLREMERYRQGFYVNMMVGGIGISAPGSGGGVSIPGVEGTLSSAGNLYGLIYTQLQLANQRQNVADLQYSMDRMEALYEADRLERTQVDQTRQSLLSSQITLMTAENRYQNSLDQYKMTLGLPPALKVQVEDGMLEPFILMSPEITQMRNDLASRQRDLRNGHRSFADTYALMEEQVEEMRAYCANIDQDFVNLKKAYPKRLEALRRLASRPEVVEGKVDKTAVDPRLFRDRVKALGEDYLLFKNRVAEIEKSLTDLQAGEEVAALDLWMDQFNSKLLDMSLLQARARLDAVMLTPVEISENLAMQVARENRLDWMNARTALVDRWRQIELAANDLKTDLTVTADAQTRLENAHTNSSLALGLTVDAPVDRRMERNAYMETLISYDRARRDYIHYQDSVHRNIRTLVRQVEVAQLNFELRRISVFVAMNRVDQANLQLLQPPKPNQTSQFGDSFARDLIDALNSLLSAQNTFVESWIGFEACRMGIEISLGIFQLDGAGMWVDRGKLDLHDATQVNMPGSVSLTSPSILQAGNNPMNPSVTQTVNPSVTYRLAQSTNHATLQPNLQPV
ncbi:MAG: hypothetical protein Q4C70_08970, partial [Planctomycetia bacterium]|nr:hypothetical protein [Planctomycetia bacterium]